MKVIALILTSIIVLICSVLVACGQPMPPALPSAVGPRTNNLFAKHATLPQPSFPAITNITLTWSPYTNAYVQVQACTDLFQTNWTVVTNVPLWATNVVLPISEPQQFFRVRAVFDGVLTNY
jgi:hypothetical protein